MDKFIGKIFIEGEIKLLTGLHIGGSKEKGEIGGLDNPVIKTIEGVPYIPGSSLKGKIRCLLERKYGTQNDEEKIKETTKGTNASENKEKGEPCKCGKCNICLLFGSHSTENKTLSRLIIRDSFLDKDEFENSFSKYFEEGVEYTEEKTENIINRITGTAANVRTIERVPAGAKFKFSSSIAFYENDNIEELVKTFIEGMRMLEDDYLGGSGTRGYGHIKFENLSFYVKNSKKYLEDNKKEEIATNKLLENIEIDNLVKRIIENLKVSTK